jgi:hypothetical protein
MAAWHESPSERWQAVLGLRWFRDRTAPDAPAVRAENLVHVMRPGDIR